MAPRAQITEILPETLPGDFVEWDEASPSPQPIDPGFAKPGPGIELVSKPAAPAAGARRAGVPPEAALSVSALENKGGAAALHPAQSLNQALLYSRDKLLQEAVPTIDEHRFSAPRPNSARAAATMTEFREIPLHSVSANGVERTEAARKKWPVIAGASAALVVILAAMIPIFNRDRAASVKPAAAPAPTVTTVHQPEDAAPTRVHSKLKVPASTAAATTPREAKISSEAARPPVQTNAGPSLEQARMMNDQLHTPTRLQLKATLADQAPLPAGGFAAADIDGSDNTKAIGAVFGSPKPPEVQIASRHVIKVTSGVALGLLIRKTQPVYPPIARTARVSGRIVLAVTISKTGNVETLIVESGPPMLRTAALDAVRTWRFKPYMLDNQPTPIETTISLYFSLN